MMRGLGWLLLAALAAAVLACARPEPARPALWEVTGPKGERGWLFGTIHALPEAASWKSASIEQSFAQADRLVVEIAGLEDGARTARAFTELAQSPGLTPLGERIPPRLNAELVRLQSEAGLAAGTDRTLETWAAALTLAQAIDRRSGNDPANGIDRALLKEAARSGKPVVELEGALNQLQRFDTLPETAQRALLAAVVADASKAPEEARRLADAWRTGDIETIGRATTTGIMANPMVRAALYTDRNHAWVTRIDALLRAGTRPLVAVGAAHMAGDDSLPRLLAARGYTVRRLQ